MRCDSLDGVRMLYLFNSIFAQFRLGAVQYINGVHYQIHLFYGFPWYPYTKGRGVTGYPKSWIYEFLA